MITPTHTFVHFLKTRLELIEERGRFATLISNNFLSEQMTILKSVYMQSILEQILVTGFKLTFVAVSEIIFQSRSMSWSVVYCDVTVNLMTYLPFKDAGTMWTFPDLFNLFKSVSVISFSPWTKNKLMYYLKIIKILFDMFWITICTKAIVFLPTTETPPFLKLWKRGFQTFGLF